MKVLVIEDNFLTVARKSLEAEGRDVAFASSFEEAISLLKNDSIGAIITDMFFHSETDWRREILKVTEVPDDWREYSQVDKFSKMVGNPSGLKILLLSLEFGRRCLIASESDRHQGELAIVRQVANFIPQLRNPVGHCDPLPSYMLWGGSPDGRSKIQSVTWEEAYSLVVSYEGFIPDPRL